MRPKRRREDSCIMVRLWEKYTPYIQGAGWLVMMCTTVMIGFSLIGKAQAFDSRLSSLDSRITAVENAVIQLTESKNQTNEKLDLVIRLLKESN